MIRQISTANAPKPFSRYSQAIAVGTNDELIFISGQVGVNNDGTLANGEAAQHRQIWKNIFNLLASQGLGFHDIVEITGLSEEEIAGLNK